MTLSIRLLFSSFLLVAAGLLFVTDASARRKDGDQLVLTSDAFLNHHPDIKYRLLGLAAYDRGNHGVAMSHFRHAARFADKPAQSMVAEMLWKGEGVVADKPLAYAWMDLAAERGYPSTAAVRERYWSELSPAQREDALRRGPAVYVEYGDDVAKPRLERVLKRATRSITGSRTGFVGFLTIQIPTPSGMQTVDGEKFFDERFWKPELYWRWQDQAWKELGKGEVNVGPVTSDTQDPADKP